MKKLKFMSACLVFFGKRPGQSLQQFGDEIKQLTPKDRKELTEMFPSVGIEVLPADTK